MPPAAISTPGSSASPGTTNTNKSPRDAQWKAQMEIALRKAEEESEAISLNLLRKLDEVKNKEKNSNPTAIGSARHSRAGSQHRLEEAPFTDEERDWLVKNAVATSLGGSDSPVIAEDGLNPVTLPQLDRRRTSSLLASGQSSPLRRSFASSLRRSSHRGDSMSPSPTSRDMQLSVPQLEQLAIRTPTTPRATPVFAASPFQRVDSSSPLAQQEDSLMTMAADGCTTPPPPRRPKLAKLPEPTMTSPLSLPQPCRDLSGPKSSPSTPLPFPLDARGAREGPPVAKVDAVRELKFLSDSQGGQDYFSTRHYQYEKAQAGQEEDSSKAFPSANNSLAPISFLDADEALAPSTPQALAPASTFASLSRSASTTEIKELRKELQAWRSWGLKVWRMARELKKRVGDLEEERQATGVLQAQQQRAPTQGEADSATSTSADSSPTDPLMAKDFDIPPPPSALHPRRLREAAPSAFKSTRRSPKNGSTVGRPLRTISSDIVSASTMPATRASLDPFSSLGRVRSASYQDVEARTEGSRDHLHTGRRVASESSEQQYHLPFLPPSLELRSIMSPPPSRDERQGDEAG